MKSSATQQFSGTAPVLLGRVHSVTIDNKSLCSFDITSFLLMKALFHDEFEFGLSQ